MKILIFTCIGVVVLLLTILFWAFGQFAAVTKGKPISAYPNPATALVVIDIQRDMTEKDGKAPLDIKQTEAVIPVVNNLINFARQNGWVIVYVTHEYQHNSILRLVTRDILLEGLPGAAMDPRVQVVGTNHFIKHKMDTFSNPQFEAFLESNKVNRLIITGMAAEACVDRTSRGGLNRNYQVTVIKDAIAGSSDSSREKKIRDYLKYGVQVISSGDLIKSPGMATAK